VVKVITKLKRIDRKEWNLVDMHHHSTVSDGGAKPQTLAKIFLRRKIGLCLTDHNQIRGSLYLRRYKDLFTIPSIEITSSQAKDILAYFRSYDDLIEFWKNRIQFHVKPFLILSMNKTDVDTMDVIDAIHDYNGVAIMAHPFCYPPKRSAHLLGDKEFVKKIDGIEGVNFCSGRYRKTMRRIKSYHKPMTAGSDSHMVSQCNTLTLSREFDRDDYIDSIMKRKN
jgi:predicted metal-dependent phosphoesterase TrpH